MRFRHANTALLTSIVIGVSAQGQLIDLGGGSAPVVDASTASGELAAFLDSQAAQIESGEDLTGHLRAVAAIRRLAASLLTSGQSLGASGTPRLVIARTIVTGLVPLDDAIAGPSPLISHAQASILADDCSRLAANVPREQTILDRDLRDAFAPLTNAVSVSTSAWPVDAHSAVTPLGSALAPLVAAPQTESVQRRLQAMESLDNLLARARQWPSHRLSADRTESIVRAAAPVLTMPAWIEPDHRDSLTQAFDYALANFGDPGRVESALDQLDQLRAIAQFAPVIDELEPISARRRAQARFNQVLSEFPAESGRIARTCDTLRRVIGGVSDQAIEESEPHLPTYARVAWRDAVAEHATASDRLMNALLQAMTDANPMTEPALLSAIRAERTARSFLTDIADIGTFLTGVSGAESTRRARPPILSDRRLLASRVLALGKELAQPNQRAEARNRLVTIAAVVRAASPLMHEQDLRDADSFLAADLRAAIIAEIDTLHDDAMQTLKLKEPAHPESDARMILNRASRLQRLLTVLDAGRAAISSGRDRLTPWAPWELTEHGWSALIDQLPAQLESAAQRTIEGGEVEDEEFAVIELVSLCSLRLEALQPANDPVAMVLAQIALGAPTPGCFGQTDREPLAAICRDLEELASARLRGENDRAEALQNRSAQAARRIIERIETDER